MSSQPNCFQIKGGEIIHGLPLRSNVLGGALLPWRDDVSDLARSAQYREFHVRFHFKSSSGGAWVLGSSPEHINRRMGDLFYFDVRDIDFEEGPFLKGLNFWPGAEWHNAKPLWRQTLREMDGRKARQALDRAEMWTLKKHFSLVLVDQHGGIRILKFVEGEWCLLLADLGDVASYVFRRGLGMRTRVGLEWAFNSLVTICAEDPDPSFIALREKLHKRLKIL